ncbi:MAG TPA: alpha-amylase family protein [Chloroflexota bacterium]|nr:alpha-amylase family protein [Chloroflexota bacterium]
MPIEDLWYKNATIYELNVESFQDSNGDGIGDFGGLTRRLGYLAGLGVTCLWLAPFYPSPRRDDGYDIVDYLNVDRRYGTLGDFVEFIHEAESFGIRVIADLVINHTSNEHPWFQAARADPSSRCHDYYVWSEKKPADITSGVVFPGYQESVWSYDEAAGAWYYHRFYDFQPDLNYGNPDVREEVHKIMGFWLQLGVSGFRVDAVPYVLEVKGPDMPNGSRDYGYLEDIRQFLTWRSRDAIMMGEANVPLSELPHYFGSGNRMQMLLNFMENQHLFNSLAQENATPLIRAMETLPKLPPACQWGTFLRNHDEIDLGRLTEAERRRAFQLFGPEPSMQLYGRGIRRRLAPMLGNDQRRIELAYSLLFTLPGTPILRYGEEIGMGDDLSLEQRDAIRTPMQWSAERNGGFSSAPREKLVRPVITGGEYGYERVNVERERLDPNSLLNRIERMIRLRKEHPEFGRDQWEVVDTGQAEVFAIRASSKGSTMVAVHNFSGSKVKFRLELPGTEDQRLTDTLKGEELGTSKEGACEIELDGYEYRWLRVARALDA